MTVQITPIDIYQNTWGDTIDRLNQLIEAANTQIVTIGGVNIGNVAITGTLQANNLVIDNFSAGTSNVSVLNANNVNANTVTAPIVAGNTGVFTNANVSANLSANVVGGNYVIANTIIAGPVYDANGNLFSANTLINGSYIATPAVVANTVQVTDVLLVERIGQNFTANVGTFSQVNANTFNGNTVNTLTLRVNNRTNLQKFSDFDFLPSRLFGTDSAANVIQYNFTPFGITLLNSPNSANAKSILQLDQVDNTADMAKPISVSTQAALDLKVDKATRVNTGTGLTGGGALTSNVTVSLNANTIASLAKADTAIQANSPLLVPTGGTAGQVLQKMSSDPNDYSWQTTALTTAVQFISQTLTQAEQTQARTNINATGRTLREEALANSGTYVSSNTNFDALPYGYGLYGLANANNGPSFLASASFVHAETQRMYTNDAKYQLAFPYYSGTPGRGTLAVRVANTSGSYGSWAEMAPVDSPKFTGDISFNASASIASNGSVVSRAADGYRIANGGNSIILRKDGTHFYALVANTESGSWNELRPLQINLSTGLFTIGNSLNVTGTISATGNITGNSDERIKVNIKKIDNPLTIVENINGYKYDKYGVPTFGFLAQDVKKELPELVHEPLDLENDVFYQRGEEPTLSLDQGNEMLAVAWEAIKALNTKIKVLEAELAELRGVK